MGAILEIDGLTVRFGSQKVLHNLHLRVEEGESLAVIGPNGSGKTVLFRALIGAVPYTGDIRWAPDVTIGYVPQKLDIERDLPLTGTELLAAKAAVSHAGPAEPAICNLSLGDEVERPIGELSGGQFQRLLLAVALIGNPSVLLLDEPTAGVDEPSHRAIQDCLRTLRARRTTVLFISHELSVVSSLATNVLCLSHQRAWYGPPRSILTPEKLSEAYGMPVHFHVHEP